MRLLVLVLTQSDWCSLRGGNLGTRDESTQSKGHVRTQWGGSHLPAKERSLRRNQISLDLRLTSLQNCEKINFCCLSHPVWRTLNGSPSELVQLPLANELEAHCKNEINPSARVGRDLRKCIAQSPCFEINAQGHTASWWLSHSFSSTFSPSMFYHSLPTISKMVAKSASDDD